MPAGVPPCPSPAGGPEAGGGTAGAGRGGRPANQSRASRLHSIDAATATRIGRIPETKVAENSSSTAVTVSPTRAPRCRCNAKIASTAPAAASAPLTRTSARSMSTTAAGSSPRPLPGGLLSCSAIWSRTAEERTVAIESNRLTTSSTQAAVAITPAIVTLRGRCPCDSLMATIPSRGADGPGGASGGRRGAEAATKPGWPRVVLT